MRNACSPEPPKENQQMPATMQTLSTVGSGDFKTRQGRACGDNRGKRQQLLEEAQGKIMREIFTKGKDTAALGSSQTKQGTEPDCSLILPRAAPGGKPHLGIVQSPWELSNVLPRTSSGWDSGSLKSPPGCWGDARPLCMVSQIVGTCTHCITVIL